MKIQGTPNMVLTRTVRMLGGKRKVVAIAKFDKDGFAEVDDARLSPEDKAKFAMRFPLKYSEEIEAMTFNQLKAHAKKLGLDTRDMKKDEMKELISNHERKSSEV